MNGSKQAVSRYDVAIVGGGLVGASLACALAPLGLKVAMIEAVPFRAASQPSYDDRTLALSDSSCRILEGLGIWPSLRADATPIREIHVSELDRPAMVVLDPRELGLDRFGHVVEARTFGSAVMGMISGFAQVEVLSPATVTAIGIDDDAARVGYRCGEEDASLEASLLIGADGAHSFVREALGIEAERHDYGQTAVICNITPEMDHRGRAWELFTPTGPFALMPHVDGRCGLIRCVSSSEAADVLEMRETDFLKEAQDRFGDRLGRFLKMGRRSSYPLRLVRALEDVKPRAAILGNAAHAIHPIGAQGFNLGLRDVAVLAELIAQELRDDDGADIGSMDLLNRYSNWRAIDQQGTVSQSDGLARIFSNPHSMVATARTAALLAHAFIPSLRRQMSLKAMGYRGRTPRLAMGEPL